jgi:cystathionine gamma-lyase
VSASGGDSTRAVRAGVPEAQQGAPFLPGPVFAAPYHLRGPGDPSGYARYANPTWAAYEAALGELEGGEAVVFASGMAAATAVLLPVGGRVVLPADGYYNVRQLASQHARGDVVEVPSTTEAFVAACEGAELVWVETPTNPGLDVVDVRAVADAAQAAGARLVVDPTLATPLRLRALEQGADLVCCSATKALSGHSDLVLGYVAARDPEAVATLRSWRGVTGSVPGPLEVWLAHRSLATLGVRLERQEATAAALAEALRARADVTDVRWPGLGGVVVFDLRTEARATAFLAACSLVAEATSFGGLHSSAERRARWGIEPVSEGFIRLSAGIEDADDLVADVLGALDAAL